MSTFISAASSTRYRSYFDNLISLAIILRVSKSTYSIKFPSGSLT